MSDMYPTPYNPAWERKQNILFVISLLDDLMAKCKTAKLFKWCAEQKAIMQETYDKAN